MASQPRTGAPAVAAPDSLAERSAAVFPGASLGEYNLPVFGPSGARS